jgi:hypothetical protein
MNLTPKAACSMVRGESFERMAIFHGHFLLNPANLERGER